MVNQNNIKSLILYCSGLLTLSAHAREGYSSRFVCLSVSQSVSQSVSLSVCHFLILEKAPFSGLKLTSVHSR